MGFQTNSASIVLGAQITGTHLGIRAHGDNGIGVHATSMNHFGVLGESPSSTGVKGTSSTNIGVEGFSKANSGVSGTGTPGVFGRGNKNGATGHNGVMGVVEGDDGAGVFGGHREKPDPNTVPPPPELSVTSFDPAPSPGAGVYGVSTSGHGVVGLSEGGRDFLSHGVLGTSEKTAGVVGISGLVPSTVPPGLSGVYGFCAEGRGVFGSSEDAEGIRGSSKNGYGGLFVSEKLAQVRLEPLDIFNLTSTGNPNGVVPGRGGDLLATIDTRERTRRCSLWFCVGVDPNTNQAQWVLVAS